MSDVARTAGVSVATVSKVVNGRWGVAQATVDRVQQVIDQLGYEASLGAQSLRSHRTNVLGILVAEFEPFSTELLKGVSSEVSQTDYELLAYAARGARIHGRAGSAARSPACPARSSTAPSWSPPPWSRPSRASTWSRSTRTPARPACRPSTPTTSAVPCSPPTTCSASATGGSGSSAVAPTSNRRGCARPASARPWRRRGVGVDESLVRIGGYRIETAEGPAREILNRVERPTAVFAANDLSAIATVSAARGLGLSVPDDLSVIGFDNVPESALASPPLTTIKQPLQQMGARGAAPARRPHRRRRTRYPRAAAHRAGGARLLPAAALIPREYRQRAKPRPAESGTPEALLPCMGNTRRRQERPS